MIRYPYRDQDGFQVVKSRKRHKYPKPLPPPVPQPSEEVPAAEVIVSRVTVYRY